MRRNNITKRLSLRAKFKSTKEVEVVIMDEFNNVQIELIPITLKDAVGEKEAKEASVEQAEPTDKEDK